MNDSGAAAHPCCEPTNQASADGAAREWLERTLDLPTPGMAIGRLVAIDAGGTPWVEIADGSRTHRLAAAGCVAVSKTQIGAEVVLATPVGRRQPIIVGIVQRPVATDAESTGYRYREEGAGCRIEIDGDRLLIDAQREIVIRCGAASITLTRAGKVLVQGEYVSSRSNGVNRICGGSVELN